MTEHSKWRETLRRWTDGHTGDPGLLKSAAHYLAASADWIEVRDALINMAMSKQQVLDWFAEQDFPDFAEAVEEGWGWPKELEET